VGGLVVRFRNALKDDHELGIATVEFDGVLKFMMLMGLAL
jgi:hypothetical protein